MQRPARLRGINIIEIMVTVAIVVILAGLGAPGIGEWIKNAQIRNTAESISSGLQMARLEALRRNAPLGFYLTNDLSASCALSSTGVNWVISRDTPSSACNAALINDSIALDSATAPGIVKKTSGNSTVNITAQPNVHTIQFSALGRASVSGSTLPLQIDIKHKNGKCLREEAGGTLRCMRITLQSSGQVRSCIPSLPSSDLRAC
jgi:type IV fimbrial biogenesis protein FimT